MRRSWRLGLLGLAMGSVLNPTCVASADIDATGSWIAYYVPALSPGSAGNHLWELSQSGTALTVAVDGGAPGSGTIDPLTGFFSVSFGPAPGACGSFAEFTLSGQIEPDGLTLLAYDTEEFGPMCRPVTGTAVATRCLNDPLGVLADCAVPEQPSFGRLVLVRDKGGDPTRRKIVVKLRDSTYAPPAASSLENPLAPRFPDYLRPEFGGARLTIARGTDEVAVLPLPYEGWRGLGNPAGSKGWSYRDPKLQLGACTKAVVREGSVTAVCRGAGIPFSLDEASQGALSASLQFGRAQRPPCSFFGGTVTRDTQAAPGKVGAFAARNAAAPPLCAGP